MEIAGPPCISFSAMGLRDGEEGTSFEAHKAWYRLRGRQQEPVVLIENVEQYELEIVKKYMPSYYDIHQVTLDPRLFGVPVARPRSFYLCFHMKKVQLKEGTNFEKIISNLLSFPVLQAKDLFWRDLPKEELGPTLKKRLQLYKSNVTDRKDAVVDLSQDPLVRPRCTLRDGSLPTIIKNSINFYSISKERFITAKELLAAMGVPVVPRVRKLSGWKFDEDAVSEVQLAIMAGNGMSVPVIGALLLAVIVSVKRVDRH
jgi:hypothetical protein